MKLVIRRYTVSIRVCSSGSKVLVFDISSQDGSKVLQVETDQGDGRNGEQLALRFSTEIVERTQPANLVPAFTKKIPYGDFVVDLLVDSDDHLNIYVESLDSDVDLAQVKSNTTRAVGSEIRVTEVQKAVTI